MGLDRLFLLNCSHALSDIRFHTDDEDSARLVSYMFQTMERGGENRTFFTFCSGLQSELYRHWVESIFVRDGERSWLRNPARCRGTVENGRFYQILHSSLCAMAELFQSGNREAAADLADAIHFMPELIAENRSFTYRSLWSTMMAPVWEKWKLPCFSQLEPLFHPVHKEYRREDRLRELRHILMKPVFFLRRHGLSLRQWRFRRESKKQNR